MVKHFFITGTDTGIGKTYATCHLLRTLQQEGKRAIGIKPVLSGNEELPTDTQALMAHNSISLPAEMITPYSFKLATSPHIAATKENQKINVENIVAACKPALTQDVDIVLIEGVGGWYVPLNETETVADLATAFNYPIILVVGLRLGCLNHALLTVSAIEAQSLSLHGWIANQIDPEFTFTDDYLTTLQTRIPAPMLSFLPYSLNRE